MTFHRDDDVAALVAAAGRGDESAWRALVERYSAVVWSVSRAHRLGHADAQDVYQYVWLTLTQNLHRIKEPDRLGAWLATVTRRECLRFLGQSARQVPTDSALEPDYVDEGTYADAFTLLEERNAELWRVVERLPETCRILLRALFGCDPPPSYEEVSAALGMPIGSMGPTRQRCLDRMRHLLA